MPVRIKWFSGKYAGISLMFFGISGMFQSIFIALGQYASSVGSNYALILIPIAVTFCLGYSTGILYEARIQRQQRDQHHRKYRKTAGGLMESNLLLSVLISLGLFAILFFPVFYLVVLSTTALASFMIAENVGAIGVLVVASILEKAYAPHANPY
jgi:uncharacterized membrane protein